MRNAHSCRRKEGAGHSQRRMDVMLQMVGNRGMADGCSTL